MSRRRLAAVLGVLAAIGAAATAVAVVRTARATACADDFPRLDRARIVSAPVGDARLQPPSGKSEWSELLAQAAIPPDAFGLEPAAWAVALDLGDAEARFNGPYAVAASDDLVAVAWDGAVAALSPDGALRWARALPGGFGLFGEGGPTSLGIVDGHIVVAPFVGGFADEDDRVWAASFDVDGEIAACRRLGGVFAYVSDRDLVAIERQPEHDDPGANTSVVTRFAGLGLEEDWSAEVAGWPTRALRRGPDVLLDSDRWHGEHPELGDPAFHVLDASSGDPVTSIEVPTGRSGFSTVYAGGSYLSILIEGGVAATGTVEALGPLGRWQYGTDVEATDRLFAIDDAVLVFREGRDNRPETLALLDGASGAERWRADSGSWAGAELVLRGDTAYASTSDVIRLDLVTGDQQRFALGDGRGDDVATLALAGDRLYVAVEHGLLAFPLAAG